MGAKSEFQQILEGKLGVFRGENAENSGDSPPAPKGRNEKSSEGNEAFSEGNETFFEGNKPFPEENSPFETLIASLLEAGVNFNFPQFNIGAKSRLGDIYPRKPITPRPTRPRPPEKTALVKDLNPEANQALCRLVELGASEFVNLEIVSESIVKRAFRRLALKLHPDQNPKANGRDFRSAREAYTTLLKSVCGI